ncbi:MAG: phosphorylase [Gammaproteobacteria bacterium]|jgi:uridine phosphorylase|nr:phosphorylase [Gammaproteobacteria bacterium]
MQANLTIPESELILDTEGRIYHLNLLPEELADTILTVGDPNRVPEVSKYFDSIEFKIQKRELITHTGYLNGKRLSVISTGMGIGNIDIVFNELDALANIDLATCKIKPEKKSLTIVRIGTAGALQPDIPIDSFVTSSHGLGLDNLLHFYQQENSAEELALLNAFYTHFDNLKLPPPYIAAGNNGLINLFRAETITGITATCTGFYGPQGRILRLGLQIPEFMDKLQTFSYHNHRLTNFEMETSAIYGLGQLLGHRCCSISAIVANRAVQKFSTNPYKTVDKLIQMVLEKVTSEQTQCQPDKLRKVG